MFDRKERELESEGLLEQAVARPSDAQRSWKFLWGGLVISLFLNIVLAVFAVLPGRGYHSSYDRGFETDLGVHLNDLLPVLICLLTYIRGCQGRD